MAGMSLYGGVMRIDPQLPAHAMKTYEITVPRTADYWRVVSCADADCPQHQHGWVTRLDETTTLGQQQAAYIRSTAGRRYIEARTPEGLTEFRFGAGQACFATHRTRIDRPELYLVRGGDFRGNPTGEFRQHVRPDDWVEDFALHQDRIADQA